MTDIIEVVKPEGTDEYLVDSVLTSPDDPRLREYLEKGGAVIYEELITEVEVNEPELSPEEAKKNLIMEKAQLGLFRRGQLSLLQEDAKNAGLGAQITGILNYAQPAIEYWKNGGSLEELNEDFTQLTDPVIRGTLDYVYHGSTVQSLIISKLSV